MKAEIVFPRLRTSQERSYGVRVIGWFIAAFLVSLFSGSTARAQQSMVLVGSGSTVPAPLYNRWAQEYAKRSHSAQLRYVPIGTSEGIKQISHATGDFAAGEAPLTERERKEGGLIELPAVLIGIVPIYNLPEVHQELRLSGEVLADIFMGTIKTWNAAPIAKLNPDTVLPDSPIHVVQRPAGKGSNYVFTDFLSKTSSKFRSQIGVSASPKWPVGEPAERSSDMAEKVKNQPGSIGYVEFQYAVRSNLPQAAVMNGSGKFVKASPRGLAAACEAVEDPRWNLFSASLIDAHGQESYPITSFTWLYLKEHSSDPSRAMALGDFLKWMYTDGQAFVGQEGYTELPGRLLENVKKRVADLH